MLQNHNCCSKILRPFLEAHLAKSIMQLLHTVTNLILTAFGATASYDLILHEIPKSSYSSRMA